MIKSSNVNRIGVLHLIDSLHLGGAERVAVNLVNLIPPDRYRACLCTTRDDGPLAQLVAPSVPRLRLQRRRTFESRAIRRLVGFARANNVRIIHAHSTSLLLANIAALLPPYPAVVWHDHHGSCETTQRPTYIYRLLTRRVRAVITVNELLSKWVRQQLLVPAERVSYVPNFVCQSTKSEPAARASCSPGPQIVCVANVSAQKDQLTLVRAMQRVIKYQPRAHLNLIGAALEPREYYWSVECEIRRLGLDSHISLLGPRDDVQQWLQRSDIGVLSSVSEGLPLSLLEYGLAGLPVVATRVGQCAEVLDEGDAGLLVESRAPDMLADALIRLLDSAELRSELSQRLCRRVREVYSADRVIPRLCQVYDSVLSEQSAHGS